MSKTILVKLSDVEYQKAVKLKGSRNWREVLLDYKPAITVTEAEVRGIVKQMIEEAKGY